MRKILISEKSLMTIKESNEEVTFFKFFTEVKNFLKGLLEDPIGAKPGDFFSKHGISRKELINKFLDRNIITKKEKIDEPMDADGNPKSMHYLKYSIPRKNFEKKIHRLYSEFFETSNRKVNEENNHQQKQYNSVATYIFCQDKDGDLCVLAGRRRGRHTKGLYNVPTGLVGDHYYAKNESTASAAVREVWEESGIRISQGMLQDVGDVEYTNRWGNQLGKQYAVMLKGVTDQHQPGEGDGENDRFEWLKINDINNVPWAFNMDNLIMEIINAMRIKT